MDAETARHNLTAREAFGRNRPDLAESSLRKLLARDPRQAWATTALSASLRAQRRYEEAVAQARLAVRSFPLYGYAHFTLGVALSVIEDLEGSLRHASEAIRLTPRRARYYGLPAVLHIEMEQFDMAARSAREGLAIEADNATLHRLLASSLAAGGDGPAARATLDEVFRLAPDDGATFLTAGIVGWRLGRPLEAEANLRRALERMPLSYDVHAILGLVLLDAGREVEAAVQLRESLRLNPYTRRVKDALARAERSLGTTAGTS